MGNKQEVPSLYNKDFVNRKSKLKKGKEREIKQDPSPKTYSLPNYKKNKNFNYIKIITWNVNMEAHSSYCTNDWIKKNNKWDLIYQQCTKQDADIICFQELSKAYFQNDQTKQIHPLIQKYMDTNNWYITFSPSSHCGYCINLINKRLETNKYGSFTIQYNDDIDPNKKFPAVILTNINCKLILFSCHLHPFGGVINASKRRTEFDRLYKVAMDQKMSEYFVLLGDTNMRENEEINIINEYNGELSCCWNIVPDYFKSNAMFTWFRNYFEVGVQGISRYDKVFYGIKLKCIQVSVFDESVSDDKYHFLSDHRGVSVVLQIQ